MCVLHQQYFSYIIAASFISENCISGVMVNVLASNAVDH